MNPFIQQMINKKINELTVERLLQLAYEQQIILSTEQAKKIIAIIKTEQVNIADQKQIERLLIRLQTEIDNDVATIVRQLLKQYGHFLSFDF